MLWGVRLRRINIKIESQVNKSFSCTTLQIQVCSFPFIAQVQKFLNKTMKIMCSHCRWLCFTSETSELVFLETHVVACCSMQTFINRYLLVYHTELYHLGNTQGNDVLGHRKSARDGKSQEPEHITLKMVSRCDKPWDIKCYPLRLLQF